MLRVRRVGKIAVGPAPAATISGKASFLLAVAAIGLALAPPALAFEDAATGFAAKPQRPFTVTQIQDARFDVAVAIDADGSPPKAGTSKHLCQAGFKAAPQNAALTQAEINAFASKPEWLDLARATMGLVFTIDAIRNVRLGGVVGAEIEATPKFGPGAAQARAYVTLHETPKGRVTLVCVTTAKAYRDALLSFRALRNSLTLPR